MATANASAGRLTRKGLATRARIVEAAAELMFRHGVAGTSNEDVLAAAHVSNSQLYHYFPDKNALVHAVIEYQADGIIDGQRPLLDQLDSIAAFRHWRDMLVDVQRQRHCEGGCPLGSSVQRARRDRRTGPDRARRQLRPMGGPDPRRAPAHARQGRAA